MRVFVSKENKGWLEVEIPAEFSDFTYAQLVARAHQLLKGEEYKGMLITENPSPPLVA